MIIKIQTIGENCVTGAQNLVRSLGFGTKKCSRLCPEGSVRLRLKKLVELGRILVKVISSFLVDIRLKILLIQNFELISSCLYNYKVSY